VLLDPLHSYTTTFIFSAHRMKGLFSMNSCHSGILGFRHESLYLLYVVRGDGQKGVIGTPVESERTGSRADAKKSKQRWQSMEIRWKA